MTSRSLGKIGEVGGPRCCKRDSYLAIREAVDFVREKLGVEMEVGEVRCRRSSRNNQCIKERCPFHCEEVMTYGQIAEMLGDKRLARTVGNALHKNPDRENIPCHRVVNFKGKLSKSFAFGGIEAQKRLLESEGVEVVGVSW